MTTRFQLRRDTAELWKANNVKLEEGEMGIEWNTQPGQGEEVITKIKIGDGINKWNDLPYITDVLDKDVSELDKSVETLSDDLNARISALSTSLTNLSNNVVHKTGNETINGAKTFTSIPYITKSGDTRLICKGTDVVQGTAPSANKYSGFRYLDNNNVELGTVFTRYHTNGELQTRLWVKTPKEGATTTAEMGINAKTDGSFYTYCPKPNDDTTSSTQIDTVGARNSKLANYVDLSSAQTITGVKTFTSTINGTAMQAYWADLAEKYKSDYNYSEGTLVQFGGEKEITIATTEANAVVSSKPGLILNKNERGTLIALSGQTPVKVIGKVNKFDKLVLSEIPGVARKKKWYEIWKPTIAITLESNTKNDEKLVNCVTKLTF